jgi:hypothetical protein
MLSVLLFFLAGQPPQSQLIPTGTAVEARLESSLDTATSSVGDMVLARVAKPVRVGGKTIIPEGSGLNGRVETIASATEAAEGRVRIVFREIQFPDGRRYPTWITKSFSASPPNRKLRYALYVGLGAGAGSLIGGRTARVSGILGGTLVGFLIAANSGDSNRPDLKLRPGRRLQLQFGEDFHLN